MSLSFYVRRIVREPDRKFFIYIPVYYSEEAKKYHRALPDFLAPFKHYTTNVIKASEESNPDLDLHDLPSDSSRIRWKLWVSSLEPASLLKQYLTVKSIRFCHPFLWPLGKVSNDFGYP